MKGYVVCVYKDITNEEKLKEYAVKARTAVEKYKGKFLIREEKLLPTKEKIRQELSLSSFPLTMKQIYFTNQKNIKKHTKF